MESTMATSTDDVFLVVMSGFSLGSVFQLTHQPSLIGRDDDAGIPIVDGGVSRHHAAVTWDNSSGSYRIMDLGSRNGTVVNGERLLAPRLLDRGDKIHLGVETILRVSFADEPETRYAKAMQNQIVRDSLTGVFNRRYFNERLDTEVAFSRRHQVPLSLLLLDLDHFKRVNDNYDHQTGDAVLRQFSRLVGRCVRSEDVFARYGGEEFVLICRDTDEKLAALLGDRIRAQTEQTSFRFGGHSIPLTVSIGVACIGPNLHNSAALVTAADRALYRAKNDGRNRVVSYSEISEEN